MLAPGATATLHVGAGTPSASHFYWGRAERLLQNPGDPRDLGDGAYLLDPDGDVCAAGVYPCLVACSHPDRGAIEMRARPRRGEAVFVRNVGDRPVDLHGHSIARTASAYPIGPDSVLRPGETMQIDIGGDPADDTRLHRHWGLGGSVRPDGSGVLRLRTFDVITLACAAWGGARC